MGDQTFGHLEDDDLLWKTDTGGWHLVCMTLIMLRYYVVILVVDRHRTKIRRSSDVECKSLNPCLPYQRSWLSEALFQS